MNDIIESDVLLAYRRTLNVYFDCWAIGIAAKAMVKIKLNGGEVVVNPPHEIPYFMFWQCLPLVVDEFITLALRSFWITTPLKKKNIKILRDVTFKFLSIMEGEAYLTFTKFPPVFKSEVYSDDQQREAKNKARIIKRCHMLVFLEKLKGNISND